MEKARKDRRKVNQPVGAELRKEGADKRRCPRCGSTLAQTVSKAPGGTLTLTYCTKCEYKAESRQIDEATLKALATFELVVKATPGGSVLKLDPEFLRAANLGPGDAVELKAIYVPGTDTVLTWVLRKID
jgi:hypothetical protein